MQTRFYLSLVLSASALLAQNYQYSVIQPPQSIMTQAYGVNNLGTVVGQFRTADQRLHGFLRQAGSFIVEDQPGAYNTSISAINDAGSFTGGYTQAPNGPNTGFVFSNGSYTPIMFPGSSNTLPQGINNQGVLVGYYGPGPNGFNRGFVYSNGNYTMIEYPGSLETYALGINDAGDIVGAAVISGSVKGYLLRNGQFTLIEPPGLSEVFAGGINNSGHIVGWGIGATDFTGFLFRPGQGFSLISYPGSTRSFAAGIASNGLIAGFYGPGAGETGFLATPETPYRTCLDYDPTKPVRSGSTIPIRLQLCDASGANLSSPQLVLQAIAVIQLSTAASLGVQSPGNANPDDQFRYSTQIGNGGGYIFNLKTTGLATGTYELRFRVGTDSATYSAPFQVR